tara:strand:- start:762 stop:1580 length:819 start_codon:yes stop_codon:yes gene_type:complete
MAYAVGKKSLGICDRCGFTYKLNKLKYEVQDQKRTGSRICPNCFDPDQPQYRVGEINTSDNISLFNPRPDSNKKEYATYFGFNPVNSTGSVIKLELGKVTITNTSTGGGGGGGASSVDINVSLSGQSLTTTLGSYTVLNNSTINSVSGNQTSGQIGTVNVNVGTTYAVTVASFGGGNRFYIDGVVYPTLNLSEGSTYTFDQSDASNNNHPLRFSTTSNGTHAGGTEYTTGVTTNGTPGNAGAYTRITVAVGAPTLYYYCTNHSGMGGQANTP